MVNYSVIRRNSNTHLIPEVPSGMNRMIRISRAQLHMSNSLFRRRDVSLVFLSSMIELRCVVFLGQVDPPRLSVARMRQSSD